MANKYKTYCKRYINNNKLNGILSWFKDYLPHYLTTYSRRARGVLKISISRDSLCIDIKWSKQISLDTKHHYISTHSNTLCAAFYFDTFLQNQFIRTRGSFLLQFQKQIKNTAKLQHEKIKRKQAIITHF